MGPLTVHPDNPRYFMDGGGRAVYLTGSHTWANIQERGFEGVTPDFDYPAYLRFLKHYNHNFTRLWAWEHASYMQFTDKKIRYIPLRYKRTGPGKALDGGLKFDVSKFNDEYFSRLRKRIAAAQVEGIYVAVMLFQGFSIEQKGTIGINPEKGNPWNGHPYNKNNNINNVNGDPNSDGEGREIHTLRIPAVTKLQERFVIKIIDMLNDFDNIIWEISNESHRNSTDWQYHIINLIKEYERQNKPKQHPVLMTSQWETGDNSKNNRNLFNSPADVVSPNIYSSNADYSNNPPVSDGTKIVIYDTDHGGVWSVNYKRIWKNFLRGNNFIYMDSYTDIRRNSSEVTEKGGSPLPVFDTHRKAMGQTLYYAEKIDLTSMTPHGELSSTQYCLASPGREYLVYQPEEDASFTVLLEPGEYMFEWFNPADGTSTTSGISAEKEPVLFTPPFDGDAVLYIKRK